MKLYLDVVVSGAENVFETSGVVTTSVGYAGGQKRTTYYEVCSGLILQKL